MGLRDDTLSLKPRRPSFIGVQSAALAGGPGVWQLPARPREVAGVAVRTVLELVLVLGLGLPEVDGLADLGHHLQARMTARADARIASRRWRLRPIIEAEDQRIARLNLLADATLSLVRGRPARPPIDSTSRCRCNSRLRHSRKCSRRWQTHRSRGRSWYSAKQWTPPAMDSTVQPGSTSHVNRSPLVASRLRAGARGLLELVQAMPSESTGSDRDANDDACGGSD